MHDVPDVIESGTSEALHHDLSPQLQVVLGCVGGAAIGASAGAGYAYCSYQFEQFYTLVLAGIVIGVIGGCVLLLARDRSTNGLSAFGMLGLLAGLVPGFQWFLAPSQHLGAGVAILCPAVGLLLGAFFDRAVDELSKGAGYVAVTAISLGIVAAMGTTWLLDGWCYGNKPSTIANRIDQEIAEQLNGGEKYGPWEVERVNLKRTGRISYAGTVEADGPNGLETFKLTEVLDNCTDIVWVLHFY